MTTSTIQIPGTLLARVEGGRIVGYVFSPAASDAGYFGDGIFHFDGDKVSEEEFWPMVGPTLMFSEDKRTAMFACEWSE